jgi:hypothetical protein
LKVRYGGGSYRDAGGRFVSSQAAVRSAERERAARSASGWKYYQVVVNRPYYIRTSDTTSDRANVRTTYFAKVKDKDEIDLYTAANTAGEKKAKEQGYGHAKRRLRPEEYQVRKMPKKDWVKEKRTAEMKTNERQTEIYGKDELVHEGARKRWG